MFDGPKRVTLYADTADEGDDRGYLGRLPVPPAGVQGRTPDEVLRTAWTWANLEILAISSGLCPRCAGSLSYDRRVCEDHDATDGLCETCDNAHAVRTSVACGNCVFESGGAFVVRLVAHTELLSFLTDHGYNPVAPASPRRLNEIHEDYEETVLSRDPFRARFTFTVADEALTLTVSDGLTVVEATRTER